MTGVCRCVWFSLLLGICSGTLSAQDNVAIDLMDRQAVEFSLMDNPYQLRSWYVRQLNTLDPAQQAVRWTRACWAIAVIANAEDHPLLEKKLPHCLELAMQHKLALEWAALRYAGAIMQRNTATLASYAPAIYQLIDEVKQNGDPDAKAYVNARFATEMLQTRIVDKSLPLVMEATALVDSGLSQSPLVFEETKSALSMSLQYRDFQDQAYEVDEKIIQFLRQMNVRKSLATAIYNRGFSRLQADPPDNIGAKADLTEAYQLADRIQYEFIKGASVYGLSLQNGRNKQYKTAIEQIRQAVRIFEQIEHDEWINVCKMLLADFLVKSQNYAEALTVLAAVEPQIPEEQREQRNAVLWYRYKSYKALGDLPNALLNIEKFQKAADVLAKGKQNEEYNRAAASLGLQLEQEKSKSLAQANELQSRELEEARRFRTFVIVLSVLSLSTLGLLIFARFQIKRIRKSRRKIRMILDNIDEGLLTVDKKRRIGSDYSRYLKELVGDAAIAGQEFVPTIFGSSQTASEEKAMVEQVLEVTFSEEMLVWEMNSDNLPREVRLGPHGERIIALRWIPIMNRSKAMDSLLVSLTDITQARAMERTLGEQEKRLRSLPDTLRELLQAKPALINQLLTRTEDVLTQFETSGHAQNFLRDLHTQKGVARTLGLRMLSQDLHELESAQTKEHLAATRERLREYQAFAVILHQNNQQVDSHGHNLQAAVAPYLESWMQQMKAAGIPLHEIRVIDGFLEWTDEELAIVQDLCLHGINNALDHGFIFPRQRGETPSMPTIEIKATATAGFLQLEIRDNGAGLDLPKLQSLAEARGFIPAPGESFQDILFQDGISTARELSITSGRGVGLSAVKSRVVSHGGSVGIQNRSDGRGTLLWARLPHH